MTETFVDGDGFQWEAALRSRVARAARRREALADARRQAARRRAHGMVERHAARLARARARAAADPGPVAGGDSG